MLEKLFSLWKGREIRLPLDLRTPYQIHLDRLGRLSTELYIKRLDSSLTKIQREELQDKIKLITVEYEALLSYLIEKRG